MSDLLDNFYGGFSDELEKIARLPSFMRQQLRRARALDRAGKPVKFRPKPGSYTEQRMQAHQAGKSVGYQMGGRSAAHQEAGARAMVEGSQARQASRNILAARKPRQRPLPGTATKQPGQVKPRPPEPSTPASTGPAPNTAVPQPNPPPRAPKTKGASPTRKGFVASAIESGTQMAPWMLMGRQQQQQQPKRSSVYV